MFSFSQIFWYVTGLLALGAGLAGCGQKGALYLPTDPAASRRATLPQVILPLPRHEDPAEPEAPAKKLPADDGDNAESPP